MLENQLLRNCSGHKPENWRLSSQRRSATLVAHRTKLYDVSAYQSVCPKSDRHAPNALCDDKNVIDR